LSLLLLPSVVLAVLYIALLCPALVACADGLWKGIAAHGSTADAEAISSGQPELLPTDSDSTADVCQTHDSSIKVQESGPCKVQQQHWLRQLAPSKLARARLQHCHQWLQQVQPGPWRLLAAVSMAAMTYCYSFYVTTVVSIFTCMPLGAAGKEGIPGEFVIQGTYWVPDLEVQCWTIQHWSLVAVAVAIGLPLLLLYWWLLLALSWTEPSAAMLAPSFSKADVEAQSADEAIAAVDGPAAAGAAAAAAAPVDCSKGRRLPAEALTSCLSQISTESTKQVEGVSPAGDRPQMQEQLSDAPGQLADKVLVEQLYLMQLQQQQQQARQCGTKLDHWALKQGSEAASSSRPLGEGTEHVRVTEGREKHQTWPLSESLPHTSDVSSPPPQAAQPQASCAVATACARSPAVSKEYEHSALAEASTAISYAAAKLELYNTSCTHQQHPQALGCLQASYGWLLRWLCLAVKVLRPSALAFQSWGQPRGISGVSVVGLGVWNIPYRWWWLLVRELLKFCIVLAACCTSIRASSQTQALVVFMLVVVASAICWGAQVGCSTSMERLLFAQLLWLQALALLVLVQVLPGMNGAVFGAVLLAVLAVMVLQGGFALGCLVWRCIVASREVSSHALEQQHMWEVLAAGCEQS
jgi:hypothetical protein